MNIVRRYLAIPSTATPISRSCSRAYVGLAFNKPDEPPRTDSVRGIPTVDRQPLPPKSNTTSDNHINSSITSWTTPPTSDPTFQVISSGLGSALLIKLPPESSIVAATGTALGVSTTVRSALTTDGGYLTAAARRLTGSPLFHQHFSTSKTPGDVLLAPPRLADIATIDLNSNSLLTVRRNAFLARTARVTVDLGIGGTRGLDAGLAQRLIHRVSGPGTLAIASYGGLCRLILRDKEEYLVSPHNLIAWDARTAPQKVQVTAPPIPPSPSRLYRLGEPFRAFADHRAVKPVLSLLIRSARLFRSYTFGSPQFVRLQGPGNFYIASRLEPRFERAPIESSLSVADARIEQLIPPEPEQVELWKPIKLAGPTEPDSPNPTYYADVLPSGSVTFALARPSIIIEHASAAEVPGTETPLSAAPPGGREGGGVVEVSSGGELQLRRWVKGGGKAEMIEKRE
ncbi:mitochondrial biogenesis AIM24-domain-containing protein [Endogone sp. FLAS-F59071]|nr:mitochondrial biogenesis AIM24-domain-containing protein [Endogone sp. FLAS-F59071]|eukprot:RUS16810.1 mitochondrial biogenesis AIM24-domain-containing protein [Endogone sp. FLAS-F59071]